MLQSPYAGYVHREIKWTERSEEHIAKHDVAPGEVEEAVNTRPHWEGPGRNGTTHLLGTTSAGRHLFVVLIPSLDGRWYVPTARDMTMNERRLFDKKAR